MKANECINSHYFDDAKMGNSGGPCPNATIPSFLKRRVKATRRKRRYIRYVGNGGCNFSVAVAGTSTATLTGAWVLTV